jgi:hypothetical protein
LIVGAMVIGQLNQYRSRVKARVEIAAPILGSDPPTLYSTSTRPILVVGEVGRLAERIREAAAMVMGLSVLSFTEQVNHQVPATVDLLVNGMVDRALLPPNVNLTSVKGVLASPRATIYLRYRAQPFGVEIVSIGRGDLDGPPIIMRLDGQSADSVGAILLVAKKSELTSMPKPFTALTEISTTDWSIEQLRERSFEGSEVDKLNRWARQYAASDK